MFIGDIIYVLLYWRNDALSVSSFFSRSPSLSTTCSSTPCTSCFLPHHALAPHPVLLLKGWSQQAGNIHTPLWVYSTHFKSWQMFLPHRVIPMLTMYSQIWVQMFSREGSVSVVGRQDKFNLYTLKADEGTYFIPSFWGFQEKQSS